MCRDVHKQDLLLLLRGRHDVGAGLTLVSRGVAEGARRGGPRNQWFHCRHLRLRPVLRTERMSDNGVRCRGPDKEHRCV